MEFSARQEMPKIIIATEYINGRATTATITVNHHRIKLMSVYFPHSGYADLHIEKMLQTNREAQEFQKEKHTNCGRRLQSRTGPRRRSGACQCWQTLNEGNNRGDWMKHWLMLQGHTALNHDVQKKAWKANDLQISYRDRETT